MELDPGLCEDEGDGDLRPWGFLAVCGLLFWRPVGLAASLCPSLPSELELGVLDVSSESSGSANLSFVRWVRRAVFFRPFWAGRF